TLWKPENVTITKGADQVARFMKTPKSGRQSCKKCGGHIMTDHPLLGLIDVYAATVPTLPFRPGLHVNYSETVLPMQDGLPKLKDFQVELGGSGATVPELAPASPSPQSTSTQETRSGEQSWMRPLFARFRAR